MSVSDVRNLLTQVTSIVFEEAKPFYCQTSVNSMVTSLLARTINVGK